MAYVKMTKFSIEISLFVDFFLSCSHSPQKKPIFHETVGEHIKRIHANMFFLDFKIYFLAKGSICTQDQSCTFNFVCFATKSTKWPTTFFSNIVSLCEYGLL
jgi:hypothetical protein